MLGVELLFRKDREWAMVIPSLIASVVAYGEFSGVYGWTPMFGHVPGMPITGSAQLLIFPLLGLICGGLARLYAVTFYGVAGLFGRWREALARRFGPASRDWRPGRWAWSSPACSAPGTAPSRTCSARSGCCTCRCWCCS